MKGGPGPSHSRVHPNSKDTLMLSIQSTRRFCTLALVPTLAFVVGCDGQEQVGAVHVKSALIDAQQGGSLAVTTEDHEGLAGTAIAVPPGALNAETKITVDVGPASIVDVQACHVR